MLSDRGISLEGDVLDLAVDDRIVEKSGKLVQLRRNAARPGPRQRPGLPREENPAMVEEIKKKVLTAQGLNPHLPTTEESNGQQTE